MIVHFGIVRVKLNRMHHTHNTLISFIIYLTSDRALKGFATLWVWGTHMPQSPCGCCSPLTWWVQRHQTYLTGLVGSAFTAELSCSSPKVTVWFLFKETLGALPSLSIEFLFVDRQIRVFKHPMVLGFLLQIDNKGNHLLVHEESSINTPAVGAAHVIKRYTARAPDELTLEVSN